MNSFGDQKVSGLHIFYDKNHPEIERLAKSIQNKIVDAIGADGMEFLLHTKNYFTATLLLKGIYFLTIPIFTSLLTPADYV